MRRWSHRKTADLERLAPQQRLSRTLSAWHLIALGVGAIVGTGIYTLVGVGAALAGPGVVLSFLIAGAICACAALAYAEVAAMIPESGSAYTYSYVALGEIFAWVVGWCLILEYSLVVSAVAVGWSGYAVGFLKSALPEVGPALTAAPLAGGVVNLPAMLVIAVVAGMLVLGTRESATVNAVLVAVKISALVIFVMVAGPHFDSRQLTPFMPYGFAGKGQGVMAAAAIIFFAFYGFDAISTAAEESRRPARDLPIGIVGSLSICTAIYVGVAVVAVGSMPFTKYAGSPEPLALILRELGQGGAAAVIGAVAVIALPTVILAFLYGQSRIFFVMARDGWLPAGLARVSPHTGTPVRIIVATAVIVAVLAGLLPIGEIAALANAGTLVAFVAVAGCMLVLQHREPQKRVFLRPPLSWIVGVCAILGCVYLFCNLPPKTRIFFSIWNSLSLVAYLLWAKRRPAA